MVREREALELEREALRLFEELVDAEPETWETTLDERTQGRPQLRSRVERLLGFAGRGELTPPVDLPSLESFAKALEPGVVEEPPVARIGAYRLVRTVGQGGMGRVFEAWQDEPRRRVALKRMHFGLDGDAALRRFRQESEVLAHLDHPHIARIIEAGTFVERSALGEERELPFFAMEFVEGGRPLTAFAADPERTRDEVLEVFVCICDAVEHGHAKGVIHRDLKPGNLLVDAHGQAKVIDFGVARVVSPDLETPTLQTEPGQVVGTVPYMSPERLSEQGAVLDARADVWSLGVVLYQLLCGRLPFLVEDKPLGAAVSTVLNTAAPRPRRLRPGLSRDLEAIVLTCLRHEPSARYASAGALGADLRRLLEARPVRARRPGPLDRIGLFVRRNRGLAATLGGLVVLGLGTAWSLDLLARERGLARERAESFEATLLAWSGEVTEDFVSKMMEDGVPLETQIELLRASAQRLDELVRRAPEEGPALLELSGLYARLGGLQGNPMRPNAGLYEEARASYDAAEALATRALESSASGAVDEDLVRRARLRRSQALQGRADLARGQGAHEDARAFDERVLAELEELRADDPQDVQVLEALAMTTLFSYRDHMGDPARMLEAVDRALELFLELERIAPEGAHSAEQGLASCYQTRGSLLLSAGRTEEALDALLQAYQRTGELLERYPDKVSAAANVATAAVELSRAMALLDYADEALALVEEALPHVERQLARNAKDGTLRSSRLKLWFQRWRLLSALALPEVLPRDAGEVRELEGRIEDELAALEDTPTLPDVRALRHQFEALRSER